MKHLVLFVSLSACVDTPPLHEPVVEQSRVEVFVVPESPRAQTDLLIVVDDTQQMAPYQDRLATLPARLAARLEWYTQRWIDLRVAVATNDGRLRRLPGASEPWLAQAWDFDYTRRSNYEGTLAEHMTTLMSVGSANSGPSQPLEAARRALETGSELVRDRAGLMILTVSAGDDLSPLPIADYVSWMKRAIDGTWTRDSLVSGIYPTGAARFDEYYKALEPISIVTSIDADYYEEAVPWVPGDSWGVMPCMENLDLDPTTPELEHECAMNALVNATWRTVPECTPAQRIERNERDHGLSAPSAPCWWVRPSVFECGTSKAHTLELSGYTRTQHPELRFDCRTQ